MELRVRVTRKRVAALAAVLALVATGSIGWAAIGDGGTVQGCVANNGTIDAIDPVTQACKDRQTPVEWYTKAGADAAFIKTGEKVADADMLDGQDSSAFFVRVGHIWEDGSGNAVGGSFDFSSERISTGLYWIKFPAGTYTYCHSPYAVVTPVNWQPRIALVQGTYCDGDDGSASFTVRTFGLDGTPQDTAFTFAVK